MPSSTTSPAARVAEELTVPDGWTVEVDEDKAGLGALTIDIPRPEGWMKRAPPGLDITLTDKEFQTVLVSVPGMSTHYDDTDSVDELIDAAQSAVDDAQVELDSRFGSFDGDSDE